MKYDELIGKLRGCDGYRCEDCELRREEFCNLVRMEKAADAIEELQQIAGHYEESAHDYFKDVCYYLERMPKWIPVSERLPKKFELVLVYPKVVTMRTDFIKDNGKWFNSPCVTHWMPLPEPPKEETDG